MGHPGVAGDGEGWGGLARDRVAQAWHRVARDGVARAWHRVARGMWLRWRRAGEGRGVKEEAPVVRRSAVTAG